MSANSVIATRKIGAAAWLRNALIPATSSEVLSEYPHRLASFTNRQAVVSLTITTPKNTISPRTSAARATRPRS